MSIPVLEDGTWIACILPNGKKALGVIDGPCIQYVSEELLIGSVGLEELANMAEITINWEGSDEGS